MLCSSRDNDYVGSLNILISAGDCGATFAGGEDENLVDGMNLITNVSSDRDLHGHQLRVEAGVENATEVACGADIFGEPCALCESVSREHRRGRIRMPLKWTI